MSQPQQTPVISPDVQPPTLEEFVALHQSQLEAMKLPKLLWKVLYRKLFQPKLIQDEDLFELEHLEAGGYQLKAKKVLRKAGDVYIIPHCAEGIDESLYQLLKAAPELTEYLAKMVDLDATLVDTNQQSEHRKKLIQQTKAMIATATAQRSSRLDGIDEEMIITVMKQAEVDRKRAEQSLIETQGDLVAAIADCLLTPEHKQLEEHMNKNLFSHDAHMKGEAVDFQDSLKKEQEYKALQDQASKAELLLEQLEQLDKQEELRAPSTEGEKYLQRCAQVYQSLFKNHFVGLYYSMKPRDEKSPFSGAVQPEEVVKTYYVMEEMGSAIIGSAEPNVALECFLCLSSGNSSWSILWPSRDIKAGEIIQRSALVPIKCPLQFK